jgi:hypothetical protein
MQDREKAAEAPPGAHEAEIEEQAAKSRAKLDEVPEPGTDPLHEGP